jgi:hypothetical protein
MRPTYSWAALDKKVRLRKKTRTDFGTFVTRVGDGPSVFIVRLYSHDMARVYPDKVVIWYSTHHFTTHRRLNEILRHTGWAVLDRNGQYSLMRRSNDGRVYPFPPNIYATVTNSGLPTFTHRPPFQERYGNGSTSVAATEHSNKDSR